MQTFYNGKDEPIVKDELSVFNQSDSIIKEETDTPYFSNKASMSLEGVYASALTGFGSRNMINSQSC